MTAFKKSFSVLQTIAFINIRQKHFTFYEVYVMSAKIANRQVRTGFHTCSSCKTQIRPTLIIKRGKGRMIKSCACLFTCKTVANTRHLLS